MSEKPREVLFVCHANVARSQMAEGYFNHFSNPHRAKSAGVSPFIEEVFHAPADTAVAVMKEEGIDISKQKVTSLTRELAESADRIYVLCKKEECPEYITDSEKTVYWDIDDPFAGDSETFRHVRDEIKRKVEKIL